jgi:hypothetical protein
MATLLCPDEPEESQVSSQLLTDPTGRIAAVLIALALAAVIKALASVLRTWIEQASRTRRLTRSLEGTKPHQRPGIITACGQLEGRSAGGRGGDEADRPAPAEGD